MQTHTTKKPLYSTRIALIKKKKMVSSVAKDVEKSEHLYNAGGNVK